MRVYHCDVRMPDNFVPPTHRVNLIWTKHAINARWDDRYGHIPQFESIPLHNFKVIEVTLDNNDDIVKYVVRGHFSKDIDIVFVLIPTDTDTWVCKTVWANERSDTHKTLDKSRYVQ